MLPTNGLYVLRVLKWHDLTTCRKIKLVATEDGIEDPAAELVVICFKDDVCQWAAWHDWGYLVDNINWDSSGAIIITLKPKIVARLTY